MNLVRVNSILAFFIVVIIKAVIFPVSGFAQNVVRGDFKLPHDVRWENSVLPAGDYVYFVDIGRRPILVRVEQKGGGFSGVFVPDGYLKPGKPGESGGLALGGYGDDSYVISLRLQGMAGDLYFGPPDSYEASSGETAKTTEAPQETVPWTARTLGNLTILNPNHEKVSIEEAEKVYLRVCEAIEREFHRVTPVRPRLVVQLGAGDNVLRYPIGEILLKKWDKYRFADGVVDLAMHYLLPPDERERLSDAAVHAAGSVVDVCELKACAN